MQINEYKNIFKYESSHFYYLGSHSIVLSLIKKYIPNTNKLKILDAGCGTGLLTKKLSKLGQTIGIDINPEAIRLAKKRGVKVKGGSISKMNFKSNSFDIVVSVDVLYHQWVDNDRKTVKELLRVLKPGGVILIKLPAYEFLRGSHDLAVYTKKRYTKKDTIKLFSRSGASIVKITYIASFLLPVVAIRLFAEKVRGNNEPHSSVGKIWPPLNKILTSLFYLESLVLKFTDLPFGISILALATKKEVMIPKKVRSAPSL